MREQYLSLKPFPGYVALPDIQITATLGRLSDTLSIVYELLGPLADLSIPVPEVIPSRRDRLWEDTCFELFLRPKNSDRYREFNLSPSGNWNVYCFSSYRHNMLEESAWPAFPFDVRTDGNALKVSFELELDKLKLKGQDLSVAISAMVRPVQGDISYWALAHPGQQPDFHHPDSFILEL